MFMKENPHRKKNVQAQAVLLFVCYFQSYPAFDQQILVLNIQKLLKYCVKALRNAATPSFLGSLHPHCGLYIKVQEFSY